MEEPSDKPSKNRRSFTREFNLGVIKHYRKHGQSIHHTSDKYKIDRKQVRNWLKKEETIFDQKKRTKAIRRGKVRFPELEQKLYDEFIQKRNEGRIIKKWWFMSRAKQIVRSDYDDESTNFKFSNNWFFGFRKRHRISLRKKTHVSQKPPTRIYRELSQKVSLLRTYLLGDLANMDQTPLPFVMDDGKTYDTDEVWFASGSSGLDKRHIDENLESYTDNKISAAQRRVLITKWVANAWQLIKEDKNLIKRSFLKCGISNALDGSENDLVNIKGIEGYALPTPDEEYELLEDENLDCEEYVLRSEVDITDSKSSDEGKTSSDSSRDSDSDIPELEA